MSEKKLRVTGTAIEKEDGKLIVEGEIHGLDEYLAAHLEAINAEMNQRCDNTAERLLEFEKRISQIEHKTKSYNSFLNHLNQKIIELDKLKEDVVKMTNMKPAIPLRFSDYADIQKRKSEQNE